MKQHLNWQNQSNSSFKDENALANELQNNLKTMKIKELISEPMPQQSSVMFKLTDECCAAINKAVAKKKKISIHYFKDSCVFEVESENGESKRFDCTVHLIGYPIDSLKYNKKNNKYETISILSNKIQVRATDKTFAETREKAQKLVEEQQKRKIKDMNNSKIHKKIHDVRKSINPPAALAKRIGINSANSSVPQKIKQAVSTKPSNALPPNVLSGMKSSAVTGSRSTSDNSRTGVNKINEFNKNDLAFNRSVQKNSTSQKNSPSFGGFVPASNNNLSSFNAPNNNLTSTQSNGYGGHLSSSTVSVNPTFRKRQYPLSQQQQNGSQVSSFKLTPNSFSDVNSPPISNLIPPKRRISPLTNQQNNFSNNSNNTNNSFVSTENIQTIQPSETASSLTPSSVMSSSIDSPNSLCSGSGGITKSQYQNINQPLSSQKTEINSLQTDSAASSTNWRQSSLSPDENINKFQTNGRSLTMPTKPSCDWSQVFGQIENLFEAKKYHEIFSTDYPEYCDCYRALLNVAKEFTELEKALKLTPVNTPSHEKMEEAIHTKFAKYQCDEDFLSKRQKHTDLRAKLEILKQRIIDWENFRRDSSNGNQPVSWNNQTASTKTSFKGEKISSNKSYNQNEQKHYDQKSNVSTNLNESNEIINNRNFSLTDLMQM